MCRLCELNKITHWYTKRNEDGYWTIVECSSCHCPMAVYKEHIMHIPAYHLKILYDTILNKKELFSYLKWRLQARSILDHLHIHLYKNI